MPRAASTGLFHGAAMLRIVELDGSLRLLEGIDLRAGGRALVTLLGDGGPDEPTLLRQASLAVDWNREDEDGAWSHLR